MARSYRPDQPALGSAAAAMDTDATKFPLRHKAARLVHCGILGVLPHRCDMTRAFNFSAGPATLPESVLRKAQEEMLEWNGAGASIVEMSHRGPEFMAVAAKADADLRRLIGIPDDYEYMQPDASHKINGVTTRETKSRYYSDSIMVDGFAKKQCKDVKLYAVRRAEVKSDPVVVRVNPDTPPYLLAKPTINSDPDFGGIKISGTNIEATTVITVKVFLLETASHMVKLATG